MHRCWGAEVLLLGSEMEKEPCNDITVLYLLFVDIEFWDGKQNSLYCLLFIFKAQILRCWGITVRDLDGKWT